MCFAASFRAGEPAGRAAAYASHISRSSAPQGAPTQVWIRPGSAPVSTAARSRESSRFRSRTMPGASEEGSSGPASVSYTHLTLPTILRV